MLHRKLFAEQKERPMKSKQSIVRAGGEPLGRISLILVLSMLLFLDQAGCDMRSSSGLRVAKYANFHLISRSCRRPSDPEEEDFRSLTTGEGAYKTLASIYVELPDGKRYLLKDLPESQVAKEYVKLDYLPSRMGEWYGSNVRGGSTFAFREGRLVYARFSDSDSICIPFSPAKEGPYVKLPITRATMVELFGEPVKWGSYRPPSGP